jgi:hypothetical protein
MHDKKGYEDCWGDDGLIARSAIYLFEAIKARSFNKDQTKPYTLRASYFEIYCEQVQSNCDSKGAHATNYTSTDFV